MLEVELVSRLVQSMVANDITTLEVRGNDYTVRLVRAPGAVPGRAADKVPTICPATGVFHPRGGDDGLTALGPGAQVVLGEPVGYVGIGPLRFLCVAAASGRVVGPLPLEGQAVRAADTLFAVERET